VESSSAMLRDCQTSHPVVLQSLSTGPRVAGIVGYERLLSREYSERGCLDEPVNPGSAAWWPDQSFSKVRLVVSGGWTSCGRSSAISKQIICTIILPDN